MRKHLQDNRILLVGIIISFMFYFANYGIHKAVRAYPNSDTLRLIYIRYEAVVPLLLAIAVLALSLYAQKWLRQAHTAEEHSLDLERRTEALVLAANAHIPICARCKMIRAENDQWQPVETFLHDHIEQQTDPRSMPGLRTTLRTLRCLVSR